MAKTMRYVIDKWGILTYLNPGTAHLGGYFPETLISGSALVSTEDLPEGAALGVDAKGLVCVPGEVAEMLMKDAASGQTMWPFRHVTGVAIDHYNNRTA